VRPRLATLLAGLLVVACAPRPAALVPDAFTGAPDRSGISLVPPAAAAPPVASLFEVTYATPSGELFRRYVDALSLGYVPDIPLGRGGAVGSIAGTSSIVTDDAAGSIAIVSALGERKVIARQATVLPVVAATAMGFLWIGDGTQVTVADAEGRALSAVEAPRATPGSRVTGFAFDGFTSFALMSGPASSVVVDLAQGRRLDLDALAPILDVATVLRHAYVLGVDARDPRHALRLLDVDLATLTFARSATLPISERTAALDGHRIVPTAGGLYVYAAVRAGTRERSLLFSIDQDFAASPLALPDDLGLDAAGGVDDALYLFGGAARNVITRVEPATGALAHYVVAPDATLVRALAVR